MRLSKYWIAASVAAIAVIAAGVTYAAIPDNNGVIHACMLKATGTIRLIDPSLSSKDLRGHCTTLETQVSWSQQGPKGDPGLQGAPGAKGDPGAVSSLDALNGIPCTRGSLGGQTGVFYDLLVPSVRWTFQMQVACVTADANEPNDTQASESDITVVGGGGTPSGHDVERTLYPAGDDDWYVIPASSNRSILSVIQAHTGSDSIFNAPIHIEIYQDDILVASGVGQAHFFGGSGHKYEIHVSGSGPALYDLYSS